jgi:predicted MFS family arabinose efflux permease
LTTIISKMISSAFARYLNNFRGFSREVWILAAITFINRAGTMVLPFLSKYLKEDLHFSLQQVGWILVAFGFGSMLGSWMGGKLSDKIGFYKVMIFSLFTSGLLFILLQFITSFWGLCAAVFVVMAVADMFRPAMFVSLSVYAKPENRTRALTLVRLAVNLGFAAGPAMGGLIIMNIGYRGLFWADGISCISSILIFAMLVKERKRVISHETSTSIQKFSVMNDRPFWLFLLISFMVAMTFFQLFTTLPLYHHDQYGLTELQTGLLMTLNGLFIFMLEMPIVGFLERKKIDRMRIVSWGALALCVSFFILLPANWAGVLVISILLMTFGEMFAFPFSNAYAMGRAPKGHEGRYMALYTMSFSMAHIMSSKTGMEIIAHWGYNANWLVMGLIALLAAILSQRLIHHEKSE